MRIIRYVLIPFVFVLSIVIVNAFAESQCTGNSTGDYTCNYADGTTIISETDYFGSTRWRVKKENPKHDNYKSNTRDIFDKSIFRDNSGDTTSCITDILGHKICR